MERSNAHLKVTFKDWETKKPVTVDPGRSGYRAHGLMGINWGVKINKIHDAFKFASS